MTFARWWRRLNIHLTANTPYTAGPCPETGFAALTKQGVARFRTGAHLPEAGRTELTPDLDLTTTCGQSFGCMNWFMQRSSSQARISLRVVPPHLRQRPAACKRSFNALRAFRAIQGRPVFQPINRAAPGLC